MELLEPRYMLSASEVSFVGIPILIIPEGESYQLQVLREGDLSDEITVTYNAHAQGSTAKLGKRSTDDYLVSGKLKFKPGVESLPLSIKTHDNLVHAPDDLIFFIELTGFQSKHSEPTVTFSNKLISGVIEDNDLSPRFTLSGPEGNVPESNKTLTYAIKLFGPTTADTVFNYSITPRLDSETLKFDSDFKVTVQNVDGTFQTGAASGMVTIPAGETQATIKVQLVDDTIAENTESFILEVNGPDAIANVIVDITDDDLVMVGLRDDTGKSPQFIGVFEGTTEDTFVDVHLVLLNAIERSIEIPLTHVSQGATVVDGDYTPPVNLVATFANGEQVGAVREFRFVIHGDDVEEGDEPFVVVVTRNTKAYKIASDGKSRRINILDDDDLNPVEGPRIDFYYGQDSRAIIGRFAITGVDGFQSQQLLFSIYVGIHSSQRPVRTEIRIPFTIGVQPGEEGLFDATPGVDYIIPDERYFVIPKRKRFSALDSFTIQLLPDDLREGFLFQGESFQIVLQAGQGYTLGPNQSDELRMRFDIRDGEDF